MIVYSPIDGTPLPSNNILRPKNCFLMTRLGEPVPEEVIQIRDEITRISLEFEFDTIDANAQVTGRDFLLKIYKLIVATPVSIAIIHSEVPRSTLENIYYEVGMAQALGKETVIVKCQNTDIPSDFVRSEYIEYNGQFENKFRQFMENLNEVAEHYETMGDMLEQDPLLAIDYYRRAFLLNNDENIKTKVRTIFKLDELENRAKNSVEHLIAAFAQN